MKTELLSKSLQNLTNIADSILCVQCIHVSSVKLIASLADGEFVSSAQLENINSII